MTKEAPRGEIILYQVPDGDIQLDVRLEQESIPVSQKLMSILFEKNIDNIGLHLRDTYKEGELEKSVTTEESSVLQLTMVGKHALANEKRWAAVAKNATVAAGEKSKESPP